MKRIAVTGGIAEGKSTVLGYLADSGYKVESADILARSVFDCDSVQIALSQLLEIPRPIFRDVLREQLGGEEIRRKVNAIMHPLIIDRLRASSAEFLEIPLLIETCLQGEFDRVWVVTCGLEEQKLRLKTRLGSHVDVETFLRTQLTSRAKTAFGDRIIRTNVEQSAVKRCVTVAAQQDLS